MTGADLSGSDYIGGQLREELPPLPETMRRLPVYRGYPVPYFVSWMDEDGEPAERGEGTPEFRVTHPNVHADCWRNKRCWVCGGKIHTARRAFVAGPMCAVNRTSAEPPSHVDCAIFSATGCPFLVRPHARRREAGLPEDLLETPGVAILRNPGVALVWVTRKPGIKRAPNGVLFDLGPPEAVLWYAEGREATREEIDASVESGLPELHKLAERSGDPLAQGKLNRALAAARELMPA